MWYFTADGKVDGSLMVVGGRVDTDNTSRDGTFSVLDPATGKKHQELEIDSAVSGSVAVGSDWLPVGTDCGTVYGLGTK